jgi:hypothetical protein
MGHLGCLAATICYWVMSPDPRAAGVDTDDGGACPVAVRRATPDNDAAREPRGMVV